MEVGSEARAGVPVVERGGALTRRLREARARLQAGGWPILQTALAASAAWYLASTLLGHERPFFAAIAAVISLGVVVGQEGRRVYELVFGVACGLAVADVMVFFLGTGTLQIGVVVALAMATALLLGGGTLLTTEAGVSALLVVTLDPSTAGLSPDRFVDALVGSGVALVVRYLFPNDPRALVERAAHPIFDELAGTLEGTAEALRGRDVERAERALARAREIDWRVGRLQEAIAAGYETARISPPRRGTLGEIGLYAAAAGQLDLAVRNVRVLARAAVGALRDGEAPPERLAETIEQLSRAVESLVRYIEEPEHPVDTRHHALEAASGATAVLQERNDLETSLLVGQIQSTAVDLLQAAGMDATSARRAVRHAGGPDAESARANPEGLST